jgi:hypothetical protein
MTFTIGDGVQQSVRGGPAAEAPRGQAGAKKLETAGRSAEPLFAVKSCLSFAKTGSGFILAESSC